MSMPGAAGRWLEFTRTVVRDVAAIRQSPVSGPQRLGAHSNHQGMLNAFQRWQAPSWKRQTLSIR